MTPESRADPLAIPWSSDASPADWILERLSPRRPEVGSLVPTGFAAYARILHRAWTFDDGRRTPIRWSELAARAAMGLGVATWFEDLEKAVDDAIESPLVGSLTGAEVSALVDLLEPHVDAGGACWFAYWEGYAWLQGPPAVATLRSRDRADHLPETPEAGSGIGPAARVAIPDRPMVMHRGSLSAAAALCPPPVDQSPNLWWPQDRRWCVASEIDFTSTYVAGSEALVEAVLGDSRLESVRADPGDRVTD